MLPARDAAPRSSRRIPPDVYVIVPAYNEARMIAGVVGELLRVAANVVVIDDGSADDTAALARSAGATVLRHVMNRGQGAALQTGIEWALRRGAQCVVTFDSDGQHDPDDIPALVDPVLRDEADIVLGSRFLGSADGMSRRRKTLLSLATAFTRLVSGMRVTDTHNGLRAFSRRAASLLHLRLDRMAHASELLDQIRRSGLVYTETPVHLRYTDYSRSKGQKSTAALRIVFDYLLNRWTQ